MYLFEISFIIGVLGFSALSFAIGRLAGIQMVEKMLNEDQRVRYSLQDDDRTLKVFIDYQRWKEDVC